MGARRMNMVDAHRWTFNLEAAFVSLQGRVYGYHKQVCVFCTMNQNVFFIKRLVLVNVEQNKWCLKVK